MSADDKALRNALVVHAECPEVMRFSLSDKGIAMTIVSGGEYRRRRRANDAHFRAVGCVRTR